MTLVRPLFLGRQHLEAALCPHGNYLRSTVAPVVGVVGHAPVAAAPNASAPLEAVDARARHHLLTFHAFECGAVDVPVTLVRPLLLGRQHLEAALCPHGNYLRSTVAPVVGVGRVASTPDALALLEAADGRARHHLLAYTVPKGWFAGLTELAPAPFLLRHLLAGGVVPKHILALGTQAGEEEAHGGKASGRLPVHSALELRHEAFAAFATLDLVDLELLLGVDVDDHPIGVLVGESAPRLSGIALGVEILGVAADTLDGAIEAVFVRALAVALGHCG